MERQEDFIRNELINLIKDSCAFDDYPTQAYQQFHRSFLKFAFAAIEVRIDYKYNSISVWNSKPSTGDPIELFTSREAFVLHVNYTDLEETLLGCIDKGGVHNRFYGDLISKYSQNRDLERGENRAS